MIFLALQPWNWGSWRDVAYFGALIGLGAISVPVALRLDLVYWSRVGAEGLGFRDSLVKELAQAEDQLRGAAAAEHQVRTVLQIGSFRVTRGPR